MPSAATTLAAVCLATAASQGLTNAQSDPAPIVLAELPMQADADTSLFRILGGMGPGTTCPDTHKCGEFHLKCPGEAPGYAVTDWNTATSELRTKVAEGKVVNMEGEVVERQNCGDSPLCGLVGGDHETVVTPNPATDGKTIQQGGEEGEACQEYFFCLYDAVQEAAGKHSNTDESQSSAEHSCFDSLIGYISGDLTGPDHAVLKFLDDGANSLGLDRPAAFRHWFAVAFCTMLFVGGAFFCMVQGYHVPFCQKMAAVKSQATASNPMVKETIYTPSQASAAQLPM